MEEKVKIIDHYEQLKNILNKQNTGKVLVVSMLSEQHLSILRANEDTVKSFDGAIYVASNEEVQIILELYKTYDSSNKLIICTDENNCGSLWNYYDNGILSEEELVEALLT